MEATNLLLSPNKNGYFQNRPGYATPLNKYCQFRNMRKLFCLLLIVASSCHQKNKNPLIGKWQLIKRSNDHQVIFQFNPGIGLKKYIYWFKNDSTLITKDDDGGNMTSTSYLLSNDQITLIDGLRSNTFYFKITGDKLSMKSIYSSFHLELLKMN